MPQPAKAAAVGGALALHAGDGRGVEGVALGAVTAFAGAHALTLVAGGLLHALKRSLTTEYTEYTE